MQVNTKYEIKISKDIFCPKCGGMSLVLNKATLEEKLGKIPAKFEGVVIRYCKACDIYFSSEQVTYSVKK
ncbi:MAG: hypothetical protein QW625_00610 [Candidatus Nanoarchaeia archaeon]